MKAKKYLMAAICSLLFLGMAAAQEVKEPADGAATEKPKEDEELVPHKVMMGETIMLIARKYKVKPLDIYEYNPDATEGIKANQILQIPMHKALGKKKPKITEGAEEGTIARDAEKTATLYPAKGSTADFSGKTN